MRTAYRQRSGSSDTCVAGVTMLDGQTQVKLALLVEPRRLCC